MPSAKKGAGSGLESYLCYSTVVMSRPFCIEFPNALYHVAARGDQPEEIFEDDADRHAFLDKSRIEIGPS